MNKSIIYSAYIKPKIKNSPENIIGNKYGKLTVTQILGINDRATYVRCKCDCGGMKDVRLYSLKAGDTRSCGCMRGKKRTHGGSKTKLYNTYLNIKSRCLDDKDLAYKDYGGRGIGICEEWCNSFILFRDWALLNGYNEDLEIDRIDNNGNYKPNNCRWVTQKVNANNKRNNRRIEFNGEIRTLAQWSEFTGFSGGAIQYRLNSGWPINKALTTPIRPFNYK